MLEEEMGKSVLPSQCNHPRNSSVVDDRTEAAEHSSVCRVSTKTERVIKTVNKLFNTEQYWEIGGRGVNVFSQ